MSQSKLMSFFLSATEKRKRDSDDSDEMQPGQSTPKKTSSDIYNDTTSISCKRSVCDPLKLKMTPKVNYLGVKMTPENFFEGKTLNAITARCISESILNHNFCMSYKKYGTQAFSQNKSINFFPYFSTKTYVMGTQKNRLNETVLLSTQTICLNCWVRKYLQFYSQKFCLSKLMVLTTPTT